MIERIARFFGRLSDRGKRPRNANRTLRTWEWFLEIDLAKIVKATENDQVARRSLHRRLAGASDVINRAKSEPGERAMEILTAALNVAADNRNDAARRGGSFGDSDFAAASAAEAWFLVTIQHAQGQIDDRALRRIETLIDQLRAPI